MRHLWRPLVALLLTLSVALAFALPPAHHHEADADHVPLVHSHVRVHAVSGSHEAAAFDHGEGLVVWIADQVMVRTALRFVLPIAVPMDRVELTIAAEFVGNAPIDGGPLPHAPPLRVISLRGPPSVSL